MRVSSYVHVKDSACRSRKSLSVRGDTNQKHSIRPFSRTRHSVKVVVSEAIQHSGLVLNALIAVGADRLDGHGSSFSRARTTYDFRRKLRWFNVVQE